MTLRVYNTLTRKKEEFQPIVPGRVGMYLCGPTVYKPAHIGHMVGPVIFDTIKRYLTYRGYDVTFVINITDIDDKIINRARERGTTVEALAEEMTRDYFEQLEAMNVQTVDHFPRATEHIADMQKMIARLIESGYAYTLNGDVYFEVVRDEDYGKLSHRSVEEMIAGTRVEANERKRHPADFALWKASKPDEPGWDSPWGKGRPGWHIECSAMSMKYLGESFDIHGGGLDLLFPHHENELAQSESCTGKPFVRYWLHNGLMQAADSAAKVGGAHDRHGDLVEEQQAQAAGKLAGSKGAASVKELFAVFHPETVRFFLLSTHYRSPIEFSEERISEVERSLEGFYRLFETFERITGKSFYSLATATRAEDSVPLEGEPAEFFARLRELRDRFLEAMDDDFNTGGAIGVLFDLRKCLNAFIAERRLEERGQSDEEGVKALTAGMTLLKELANILGVFSRPVTKRQTGADDALVTGLMDLLIDIRSEARKQKNFELADRIRDRLHELNVTLEDRPDGTVWRRE